MPLIQALTFPVNQWAHLYSLQQAVTYNNPLTGRKLTIKSRLSKAPFLPLKDTAITIHFEQVDQTPEYLLSETGDVLLGILTFSNGQLETCIQVDGKVFEELRKNLMEYADIEGIHIMLTLGIICDESRWNEGQSLPIVQLDYAMKGD